MSFSKAQAVSAALLAIAALMVLQPAHAQNVSARVQWYGVYTVSESKSVEDPRSPTGVRIISTPIAPKSNSDQIPGRDDVRFGFSYVLSGSRGQEVTIRRVFRFPGDGMSNITTGEKTRTYEDDRTYSVGEPILMGWSFVGAAPPQIPLGEWSLEVWLGNQMIVGRRFMVQ